MSLANSSKPSEEIDGLLVLKCKCSHVHIQTSNLKGALPVCTISLLSNKITVQTLNKGVPKLKTSLSGSQMAEEKQECIPAGCAPSTGVAVLVGGGVCLEGCLPGGLCVCPEGYLPRGLSGRHHP